MKKRALLWLLPIGLLAAPADRLEFEVASVRVAKPTSRQDPQEMSGGPGTSDPGRITYRGVDITKLILAAYGIKDFQLSIADSLKSKRYDITARIPEGTTKAQFNAMLQNLLADRVGLRFHRQPTQFDTYRLVVGSRGLKLQGTVFKSYDPAEPKSRNDPDGFNPSRGTFVMGMQDGVYIISGAKITMHQLANVLEGKLRSPVVDATGLTGEYDIIKMSCSREGFAQSPAGASSVSSPDSASAPVPSIFQALEQQLGLKLEKSKAMLDVLIVDHLDEVPTDN